MKKSSKPLPKTGDESAASLYQAVGVALSYWEAADDVILDAYRNVCGHNEPLALEAFIQAPRVVRTSMFKSMLNQYKHYFTEDELKIISGALNALDKLATTRNQIAHGYVQNYSGQVDKEVVASGHYLLPAMNERGPFERNPRFHFTVDSINAFTEEVRTHRWAIFETYVGAIQRVRTRVADEYGGWGHSLIEKMRDIATHKVIAKDEIRKIAELYFQELNEKK